MYQKYVCPLRPVGTAWLRNGFSRRGYERRGLWRISTELEACARTWPPPGASLNFSTFVPWAARTQRSSSIRRPWCSCSCRPAGSPMRTARQRWRSGAPRALSCRGARCGPRAPTRIRIHAWLHLARQAGRRTRRRRVHRQCVRAAWGQALTTYDVRATSLYCHP
jgi:hypothetical protein